MAHENLKFPLSISRTREWQPILASQDFGTFYVVYIKINSSGSRINEVENTEYYYNCDFKIQNFVGAVTMGLTGTPDINIAAYPDYSNLDITINIAPFNTNFDITNRELILENPIEKDMIIQTVYGVDKVPSTLFNSADPDNSAYLNPHTIIRDGDTSLEIGTRAYGSDKPYIDSNHSGGGPYRICTPNLSRII